MVKQPDEARLDHYDKTEWRDVCRKVAPAMSDEDFEVMWADFHQRKEERKRKESLQ